MDKPIVDLTSKSRVLPDGRMFPKTPNPNVIKESFGSVELLNTDQNEQAKKEVCNNIKDVLKQYVPADKMDEVEKIINSVAEGYVFTRKEGK